MLKVEGGEQLHGNFEAWREREREGGKGDVWSHSTDRDEGTPEPERASTMKTRGWGRERHRGRIQRKEMGDLVNYGA